MLDFFQMPIIKLSRLLRDSSSKQCGHVKYWLGLHLRDFLPSMACGPHSELISPYFQHMRLLLVEGLILGDIDVRKLAKVTARGLYMGYTSTFPPPKVIFVRPYMKYRTGPRIQFAVCCLSVVCCLSDVCLLSVVLGNFKGSAWSLRFMQVILLGSHWSE